MLEFLVDNIFVVFEGNVFQQIVGIPMVLLSLQTYFCTHTKRDSYSPCSRLERNYKHLSWTSHIDTSMTYCQSIIQIFRVVLVRYPVELEIKDTTESYTSASYFDLPLSIGRDGQLRTSLYDERDDFNFHITNFPFLSSNISSSPAYGVIISRLYGMPGFATLMNVLLWERCDFHLNFSGRDMSGDVWSRP